MFRERLYLLDATYRTDDEPKALFSLIRALNDTNKARAIFRVVDSKG